MELKMRLNTEDTITAVNAAMEELIGGGIVSDDFDGNNFVIKSPEDVSSSGLFEIKVFENASEFATELGKFKGYDYRNQQGYGDMYEISCRVAIGSLDWNPEYISELQLDRAEENVGQIPDFLLESDCMVVVQGMQSLAGFLGGSYDRYFWHILQYMPEEGQESGSYRQIQNERDIRSFTEGVNGGLCFDSLPLEAIEPLAVAIRAGRVDVRDLRGQEDAVSKFVVNTYRHSGYYNHPDVDDGMVVKNVWTSSYDVQMGEYYEEDVYYGERGNYEHEIQKKTISPISNKPGWALAQIEKWANRLEGCGNFHREEFVLFLVDEEREGDTNMSSIKIFKITVTRGYRADEQGSRYSLEPWSGDNIDYSGYDDGGTDYILPDEYELGEDITGALRVYRKDNGQHIEISGLKAPVLIDDKPRGIKLMPLGGRYVG